jgi:transposase
MRDPQVCVGIDVSTAPLDGALRPTDDGWQVNQDEVGIARLVECLRTVQPTLGVRAAPGGLAVPVTGALAAARVPGVVVHPRHARDVATAPGRLATPAPREARGLAHVAEAVRPTPRPRPEAPVRAVLTRQRPWVQRLTAARRRLQPAPRGSGPPSRTT